MTTEPFVVAVKSNDADRVRAMVRDTPALVNAVIPKTHSRWSAERLTPLHLAVEHGHLAVATVLVDHGADLEARNAGGRTPLHDSIELGHDDISTLLMSRGATVDICAAAILGRMDRLRELLDHEPARANDRSTHLSPLAWASFGNQVETARELVNRGARMDDGELQCAASVGHVAVGRTLIDLGADPNEVFPENGQTALHAAAAMKYTDDSTAFVRMMLEAGADPTIPDRDGRTPLTIARAGAERQRTTPGGRDDHERNFDGVADLLSSWSRHSD